MIIANGGPLLIPTTSPGTVTLDGIQIVIFYLNGTPQIFGPNQQQGCGNCPLTLTGGTTFTMGSILVLNFPPDNTTTYSFNATSPIPFEEWECYWSGPARPAGWPPTGCPFTTAWQQPPFFVENGAGGLFTISYPLSLSIPNPTPDLPGGFDLQIVLTVSMTAGINPPP